MSGLQTQGFMQALEALREQGRERRAELLGADYAHESENAINPFARELFDHFLATGWGAVWNRPHLTARERALVTLAAAAAAGRLGEVSTHTRGALGAGATALEIREVVIQVSAYCGIGVAAEAMGAVIATLEQLGVDLGQRA